MLPVYESQTFEAILKRMLDRVPNDVDKREGSIIYDALAPAAAELAQMYMELEINKNLSYADTSSGEFLERRTAEFGVTRRSATVAIRKGLFYGKDGHQVEVEIGSRFSISNLIYSVTSEIASGGYVLHCQQRGVAGNQPFGLMIPLEYIDGLVRAELSDVLVPGAEEESDDSLRQRFFNAVNEKPFAGNIAAYKQMIGGMSGVGGVKVYPAWAGGGTVKCTIIASDHSQPSQTLINEVQTAVDPIKNSGQGLGFAPIGHSVTITAASGVQIDVVTSLALAAGTTVPMIQQDIEEVINDYLLSLREQWKDQDRLTVRISQIEARILSVSGIVDVMNTTLNGAATNVELLPEELPVPGVVMING